MWYRVKISRNIKTPKGKDKNITEYYLTDQTNFAEAGYKVMKAIDTDCEIEDVCLMKNLKPTGNIEYQPSCKVFIVKFAEEMEMEDGTMKTMKYPVPFYANNNTELQKILELYLKQGLENMRITTVSETQWKIIQ
jgi:hypothetical protein